MVIVLVVLIGICMLLTMQYARSILAVRSLRRQLEEIERGSHMEISVECRQREMLSLCRQLNRLRQHWFLSQRQYEKAEKKLKQNITSLAHDIRTPLTGAAGYIQLAQECEDFVKREHYLETASDRLKELGDMLEELFLYTKLTSVEFELNMCELQVLPLLSECLVSLYRQFEEKGVSPEVEFESESFRIKADEECLRRIFHNLIQNGLIHGKGGLSIRQSKTSVFFENLVSETSVPDTAQIFDRFYKADSARRKGSSGLGMFIVKELAERMGGQVEAQLNGQMLTIRLEFPEVE
ncbi:MAG: HAMP domain-containing histidine kinase [Dorea sp.]|jgi:signal transduction histidine kinase|nr:HAMP domain-containing histidine kinase [Dorea sp.]